ncbi:hypothetical protein CVT25_008278 [Psilocybe cyanescens]|uniref:Uncharacterized protein n=1 Tax=Psilocybe cyanescens TaxID=93625 RepID=A0A409X6V8_PSICY|nr:hypothetical protein CVT25_008278 [Psilocybe cyanescens]
MTSSRLSLSLSPFPTRTRPWEPRIHIRTLALRRAWRLLEARGEADAWVRGVGTGDSGSGSGKTAEKEWVNLMWRVLKWGEGEGDREGAESLEGAVQI